LFELAGALVGFATPFIGRGATSDWTIDGGHFAERCEAFVLVALGESIVASGTTVSRLLSGSADAGTRGTWPSSRGQRPGNLVVE